MAGPIAIVIVLLLIPVLVLMGGAIASAVLGHFFVRDAEARHEGSELIELNR
ncbi:MAG: hypothetical protein MUE78_01405 [Ilumatobacteraceae bacterium]|jgi:hypothetical protein|nr:hypothetical protein [Ilumatobacteraceae bacterium]